MAKKEKPEIEEPSAPFWLVTFSDMVTLLMVFFILILSFSTIELKKFKGAMSSMKGALGVLPKNISTYQMPNPNYKDYELKIREEIVEKMEAVERKVEEMGLDKMVELEYNGDGVLVRLGDKLLFNSGQAYVKKQAYPVLKLIMKSFKGMYNEVYVEGHTDNVPIHSSKYPSNWELSAARALHVVEYMNQVGHIPAEKLAAVGHGEHRPLVPNTSAANRAKNRRVEILFKMH